MVNGLQNKGRLGKLKALESILEDAINSCEDTKSLAQLSRQYRETLREIEEIEGVVEDDEISEIMQNRKADGKSGSIR